MAITNPNSSHHMVAYQASENGAVRQFRNPSKFDVLSGRGGSVNAHAGNVYFREIVQVRKVEYNIESNKERKNQICREVIAQVTAKGGTFLVKENSNTSGGGLWTELSEERTMAKVSQALREGAPRMRQAFQKNPALPESRKRSFRKRPDTESANKRVRVEYRGHQVHPNDVSPLLASTPNEPELPKMAPLSGYNGINPNPVTSATPIPKTLERSASSISLTGIRDGDDLLNEPFVDPFRLPEIPKQPVQRAHSLVLSDISPHPNYLEDDFVNPFDEETEGFLRPNHDGLEALFRNEDATAPEPFQTFDSISSLSQRTPMVQ